MQRVWYFSLRALPHGDKRRLFKEHGILQKVVWEFVYFVWEHYWVYWSFGIVSLCACGFVCGTVLFVFGSVVFLSLWVWLRVITIHIKIMDFGWRFHVCRLGVGWTILNIVVLCECLILLFMKMCFYQPQIKTIPAW